jgi:hypothetical protein
VRRENEKLAKLLVLVEKFSRVFDLFSETIFAFGENRIFRQIEEKLVALI